MLRVAEASEPLAAVESADGRPDAAFTRLIAAVQRTTGDEREKIRERLIELFQVVGPSDPLVSQARKALANALF